VDNASGLYERRGFVGCSEFLVSSRRLCEPVGERRMF
jgi:hypothetical protein